MITPAKRGRDSKDGIMPKMWEFSSSKSNLGNPNLRTCSEQGKSDYWESKVLIDWTNTQDSMYDLRQIFVKCVDCVSSDPACYQGSKWVPETDLWRPC